MQKSQQIELSMSRIYEKLNELSSRLTQPHHHCVRLNVDVPTNECTNVTINLKNVACQASSLPIRQQSQNESSHVAPQPCKKKQYFIKVNPVSSKQHSSQEYCFQQAPSSPLNTTYPKEIPQSWPSAQYVAVTQIKPSSTDQSEKYETEKRVLPYDSVGKAWQPGPVVTPKVQKSSEVKQAKVTEVSFNSINKDEYTYSPSHCYTKDQFYNSEALLSNFTTEVKQIEEKQEEYLSASRKTAEEYSNRLQALNEKLKNSFMKVQRWQIHEVPVFKQKTATSTSKRQITPLKKSFSKNKKTQVMNKTTVPPFKRAETAKSSRIMINSSQCTCLGQRTYRSKRSISPFFQNYDYKYNLIENLYKKVKPQKKKEQTVNKDYMPSNCRNIKVNQQSMNQFIKDVRKKYKERNKSDLHNLNFQILDSNKKYDAHRLDRSPVKTKISSKKRLEARSLSPLQTYHHRCLACCEYR